MAGYRNATDAFRQLKSRKLWFMSEDQMKMTNLETVSGFENMDLADLMDVLEDRDSDVLLKLAIDHHPNEDQMLRVVVTKNGKETLLIENFVIMDRFPVNGFSTLLFLRKGPVILDTADYNRCLTKVFDIIRWHERRGLTVKCLNIGLLRANCYKSHNNIRTDFKGFTFDDINYHTGESSFDEVWALCYRLKYPVQRCI